MAQPIFVDEGVFQMWCFALPEADGAWEASVTFERREDFRSGQTRIRGVRHVLEGDFVTEDAALQAAISYASHMANHAADDVEL